MQQNIDLIYRDDVVIVNNLIVVNKIPKWFIEEPSYAIEHYLYMCLDLR